MAHVRAKRIPSESLGRATLTGISNAQARLAEDTLRLYSDAALTAIAGSLQHALEIDMDMTNWKPQSAYHQRLEKVEAELKLLLAERDATAAERDATAAERDAAHATARKAIQHAQEAVRTVLAARDLRADAQALRKIQRCEDLDQLHAWLTAAISADTVQDVFDGRTDTTH